MKTFELHRAHELAQLRKPGYLEAILSCSRLVGTRVFMDDEDYVRINAEFGLRLPPPKIQPGAPNCCNPPPAS